MPLLSVVIISWNSERHVKDCLDSLLKSTEHLSTEIFIIDNGSTDATLPIIESYPENTFTLIRNAENTGVSKARNIGLSRSSGQFIWILDIDTIVNREAVSGLLDFIKENPDCGICACKLTDKQGNIQDSCRKHPSFRFKINNMLESLLGRSRIAHPLRNRIHRSNETQFYRKQMLQKDPFEVDYVIGACQLIRAEALKKTGLLDEKIFYGPEDTDLCIRMQKNNYSICYLPAFSIIHDYQQITNKKIISSLSLIHLKALFYYFRKHKRF